MSQYGAELQKFVTGEIRTDGFKSDWRKEQERRRVEDAKETIIILRPKRVERYTQSDRLLRPAKRRAANEDAPVCSYLDCLNPLSVNNVSGLCKLHSARKFA